VQRQKNAWARKMPGHYSKTTHEICSESTQSWWHAMKETAEAAHRSGRHDMGHILPSQALSPRHEGIGTSFEHLPALPLSRRSLSTCLSVCSRPRQCHFLMVLDCLLRAQVPHHLPPCRGITCPRHPFALVPTRHGTIVHLPSPSRIPASTPASPPPATLHP